MALCQTVTKYHQCQVNKFQLKFRIKFALNFENTHKNKLGVSLWINGKTTQLILSPYDYVQKVRGCFECTSSMKKNFFF